MERRDRHLSRMSVRVVLEKEDATLALAVERGMVVFGRWNVRRRGNVGGPRRVPWRGRQTPPRCTDEFRERCETHGKIPLTIFRTPPHGTRPSSSRDAGNAKTE